MPTPRRDRPRSKWRKPRTSPVSHEVNSQASPWSRPSTSVAQPPRRAYRVSRRNVEKAIRDKGFGISRSRLDEVKNLLQAELDEATTGTN